MEDQRKSNRGNRESSSGCYSDLNDEDMTYSLKGKNPSRQKMNSREDSEPATSGKRAPLPSLTTYNPKWPVLSLAIHDNAMPLAGYNPMLSSVPGVPSQRLTGYNPMLSPVPGVPSQRLTGYNPMLSPVPGVPSQRLTGYNPMLSPVPGVPSQRLTGYNPMLSLVPGVPSQRLTGYNPMLSLVPGVPSQRLTGYNPMSIPIPISIPEVCGGKNIDDAKEKMTETARKEQYDWIPNVAAPIYLPSWEKPAIIRNGRNLKDAVSFLRAMVQMRERGDHTGREAPLLDLNSPPMEETRINMPLECDTVNKDHDRVLKLELPHSGAPGSSTSYLSNEESGNLAAVSATAANIATKWLELMSQDTSERLAALRCSKKRAKAMVLSTRKEISSNPDLSHGGCGAKWIRMFKEMEKSLCEEEVKLEKWLNQLNQIQSDIERAAPGKEKDFAAAAALYSTCNFMEKQNHP